MYRCPKDHRHDGSDHCYRNHGCLCEPCSLRAFLKRAKEQGRKVTKEDFVYKVKVNWKHVIEDIDDTKDYGMIPEDLLNGVLANSSRRNIKQSLRNHGRLDLYEWLFPKELEEVW